MKLYVLILAAVVSSVCASLAAEPLTEERKIDMLIGYVRGLDGAVFIRNGAEYPAAQAAEHLSMKRKKAGGAVKNAADFIEKIASASYLTGAPYTVRMPDGKVVMSRDLLYRRLKEIEQRQ